MIDHFEWILDDSALANVCELWSQAEVLAIDTEFVRTDTFYAHLGLIQVCQKEKTWLIDPLEITHWQPFADIVQNEAIVKVLHSLSEDAEILLHHLKAPLNNVFDTQIAAGFLGYAVQMSYAKLVEELFQLVLPKEATRSDWLQRPLDAEQCQYAAADVHWLYQVYEIFSEKLKAQNRYEWVKEDSQRMVSNNVPVEPSDYYLKLRGAWKLKGNRLLALKQLCTWRETLARANNVNRGRILHDKDLIALAEKMPTSKAAIQKVVKLPSRKIRLYGDHIVETLRLAQEAKRTEWPDRIEGPLPADQAHLLKSVRSQIAEAAESINIPVEIIARRKDLEAWLRSGSRDGQYDVPESLLGWRKPVVVEPIQQYLNAQWEAVNEA